jgi:hypothetical protein
MLTLTRSPSTASTRFFVVSYSTCWVIAICAYYKFRTGSELKYCVRQSGIVKWRSSCDFLLLKETVPVIICLPRWPTQYFESTSSAAPCTPRREGSYCFFDCFAWSQFMYLVHFSKKKKFMYFMLFCVCEKHSAKTGAHVYPHALTPMYFMLFCFTVASIFDSNSGDRVETYASYFLYYKHYLCKK